MFSPFYRCFGVLLLVGVVVVNLIMLNWVEKSLTIALMAPIRKIQFAVHQLKAGDFDIDIKYEGQDEIFELVAGGIREKYFWHSG